MGQVGARLEAAPHLEALVEGEVGVEDVEATVVRMAPRRHVPLAAVLSVHRRDDAAPPPAPLGDQVGDEPVQAPVDQPRTAVERSGERRVWKEGGSTCISRWSPYH